MKICSKCGKEALGKHAWCSACSREYRLQNKERINLRDKHIKQERKLFAIEYLGGVCQRCGQMPHPAAMAFHHKDPSLKEHLIKDLLRHPIPKLQKELDKCLLLCHNCHSIIHQEERDLDG